MNRLCRRAGISRQGWYQSRRRSRRVQRDHRRILHWVRAQRSRHPRMGGRKLYHRLKPRLHTAGIRMGRDKFFALLRAHSLLVPRRTRRGPRTTNGARSRWGNQLAKTSVTGPNQAWVADITYLRTLQGHCYLAMISDKYSRKILGWDVSESLELQGAMKALKAALAQKKDHMHPIHHSDRGSQYRSRIYVQQLLNEYCQVSMTEENHCAENAQAERLNGVLKQEYLLDQIFTCTEQARQAAREAIRLYNTDRPHLSLNYATPEQVHRAA